MHIRSLVLLFAGVVATIGCGAQQATAPSPVSPSAPVGPMPVSYAGEWTITAMQTVCVPASRYTCQRPPIQATTHTLRLAQIGSHVTGMLNGVDVVGDVDTEGRLRLTGHAPIPDYGGRWDVTSFEVTQTASGGLDGQWANEWWIPENFEPLGGSHRSAYTILGAARGGLPASFTGRWTGYFQTKGCTDVRCAGPEKEFDLRIDEAGGVVTGALTLRLNQRVPVTGTAAGMTADLTGVSDDGVPSTLRITNIRLQRSVTGRLTGTFTAEYTWRPSEDLELVEVSLVPTP